MKAGMLWTGACTADQDQQLPPSQNLNLTHSRLAPINSQAVNDAALATLSGTAPTSNDDNKKKIALGVGLGVGLGLGLTLIAAVAVFMYMRRKKQNISPAGTDGGAQV